MTIRIKILSCIVFFFLIAGLSAQPIKSFSTDGTIFIQELTQMFEALQSKEQKDAGLALMFDFSDMWLNNKFGKMQRDSIYAMCNTMLKRKMKTYPNFDSYIRAAIRFSKSSQNQNSFQTWCYSLRKLAAMSNSIRFMDLLDATNSLLDKNILYESQIMRWQSTSNDYTFKFDSIPYIVFGRCDLICVKKNDSSVIYRTEGTFYPTTKKWVGKGGTVTWERAGFGAREVYAEIYKYELSIQKSEYSVDTVKFYNYKYFDRPLYGSLQEKIIVDVGEDRISYPRFLSFEKEFKIKNVFQDIDYEGGFALHGQKFMGTGGEGRRGRVVFHRNNKPFISIEANTFIITKGRISTEEGATSIHWLEDSIYHPGLKVRYIDTTKELSLMRGKTGISSSPFYDTYHRLDMYVDAIYWKADQPKMDLQTIKGMVVESAALFESDNYFSEYRYERLRGMDDTHPLLVLSSIARAKSSNTFSINDVQRKMRVSMDQVVALMISFANKGFLMYDVDRGIITLKNRVSFYINARNKLTDYDVIQFSSYIAARANATLNLLNFDLLLRGVQKVFLSDSQAVYVIPDEQELIVKKNRDFTFDGRIHAGLFDFYGKNFTFLYDKFKIDLENVDSLSFKVQDRTKTPDLMGHYPLVQVRSVIEDLMGDILIDEPKNKSGLKRCPQYPVFNSKKDSYVYYQKREILNSVYTRDRFYYRVLPFTIDSLDSYFSERKSFSGYLVSAGIFPDISEPLRVQPDLSLGFVMETGQEGLPAYGAKGIYDSIIDLSFKGFRGKGTLKYLTSTMKSNDIIFYPDSMVAKAYSYYIAEKLADPEYPEAIGENVLVKWYPYDNKMRVTQNDPEKLLSLFYGQTKLEGGLTLEPTGLSGDGHITFNKVEMTSKLYQFGHHAIQSDTTDVLFKTKDSKEIVMKTQNFNVNVNFHTQRAKFRANSENSKISFPFNKFAAYMYNFDWYDMTKDELVLVSSNQEQLHYLKDLTRENLLKEDFGESRFISEHPGQDSLEFYAPEAKYNLGSNIIYARDVPVVYIADAAIFPDSGNITIMRNAEILPLDNTEVLANVDNQRYTFYESNINLISRKDYSGRGYVDFYDETDRKQKIYFSDIYVDSVKTRAKGIIEEENDFTFSPYFRYKGNIHLKAEREFLFFDGGTRITFRDCDPMPRPWFKFAAEIDPKDIHIPVDNNPREFTIDGKTGARLGMGLYACEDTTTVYSAFAQYLKKSTDSTVLTATGFLTYDKADQIYTIQQPQDTTEGALPVTDFVSFDMKKCITGGEGKVSLANGLGRVKLQTFGSIENTIMNEATEASLVMIFDFPFDDAATEILTKQLETESRTDAVDPNDPKYFNSIVKLLGLKKAENMFAQLNTTGRLRELPEELVRKFYIADIEFKWNQKSRSFVSDGKIGFANIGKTQMYRYVTGFVEIAYKRNGTAITFYIEAAGDWYFFSYQTNRLQAYSSNKTFNEAIKAAMADKKNVISAKDKLPQYSFILITSGRKKNDFLRKIGADKVIRDSE